MAYSNFFIDGSYTRIKRIVFDKKIGNIDIEFEVLDQEAGESILPGFIVKISKTKETQEYIEKEKAKLIAPPNEKPEDQTQEEYDTLVSAYTEATQLIYDNAPDMNAFSQYFTKDALYTDSNIEALCYNWCKNLPMFEGVSDV